jgi:hypothetical protein
MEVTGKIKMIDQTKEVGSGGFKRDVVVTDEQYPHIFLFNLFKINVTC